MGERIKTAGNEIQERWHKKMPPFFYWVVVVACGIACTAFAIHNGIPALGGTHADWWEEAYRYIMGGCIATVFVCKFTVAGGYKELDPDKILRNGRIVDRSSQEPNMSDVETCLPGEEKEDTTTDEAS